jgi:hypothetical protein
VERRGSCGKEKLFLLCAEEVELWQGKAIPPVWRGGELW